MKKRIIGLVLVLCLLAGCFTGLTAQAELVFNPFTSQEVIAKLSQFQTLHFLDKNGDAMAYRLYVPPDYDENREYPVILFLHGNGFQGTNGNHLNGNQAALLLAMEQEDCIVVAPQARSGKWIDTDSWYRTSVDYDSMDYLLNLETAYACFNHVLNQYSTDLDRLYCMGYSMGGYGTWEMVYRHPGIFAGAIPICGCGDPTKAEVIKDTSFWIFHGESDGVIPSQASINMYNALVAAGCESVRLTTYPGVDHSQLCGSALEPDTGEWLFAQTRRETAVAGKAQVTFLPQNAMVEESRATLDISQDVSTLAAAGQTLPQYANQRIYEEITGLTDEYIFEGWYTDRACTTGNEFTVNTPISGNLRVYGKWTKAEGYSQIKLSPSMITSTSDTSYQKGTVYKLLDEQVVSSAPSSVAHVIGNLCMDLGRAYDLDQFSIYRGHHCTGDIVISGSNDAAAGSADPDTAAAASWTTLWTSAAGTGTYMWAHSDLNESGMAGAYRYLRVNSKGYNINEFIVYGTPATVPGESQTHTVSFVTNRSGVTCPSVTVPYGSTIVLPEPDGGAGFEFEGWYTYSTFLTRFYNTTPVTADITLYAQWETVPNYTITYFSEGQQIHQETGVNATYDYTFYQPQHDGYKFGGWFFDEALTQPMIDDSVQNNLTLYAKWYHALAQYENVAAGTPFALTTGNQAFFVDHIEIVTAQAGGFTLTGAVADDAPSTFLTGELQAGVNAFDTAFTAQSLTIAFSGAVSAVRLYGQTISIDSYALTSRAEPAPAGFVSGAADGTYRSDQWLTLEATSNTGYAFVGWFANGNCLSYDATYTFRLTGDLDLTAQFALAPVSVQDQTANVQINATGNGNVTVNEEPITTDYTESNVSYGTVYTLNAQPAQGYKFLYWLDNTADRVISYYQTYQFTLAGPADVTAVFQKQEAPDDPYCSVVFMDANNKIAASMSIDRGLTVTSVPTVGRQGYVFSGWKKKGTFDDRLIQFDQYPIEKNIIFFAVYQTDTSNTFDIHVSGGTVNGETSLEGVAYGTSLMAVAPQTSNGLSFAYWMKDGIIASYLSEYTFYAVADAALEAVYLESPPAARPVVRTSDGICNPQRDEVTFNTEWQIPSALTVISAGIIFTQDASVGENMTAFVIDAQGVERRVSRLKSPSGQYIWTRTKDGAGLSETQPLSVYVRGYVIYQDADGSLFTAYSDIVVGTTALA